MIRGDKSKEARAVRGLLRIASELSAEADMLEEAELDERDSIAEPSQTSSTGDNFHKQSTIRAPPDARR